METTVIDKLAWLHIQGGKLLGARSRGRAAWYVPGGKREPGESDADALAREISEELSVELDRGTIAYVATFTAQADGKPPGTLVRVTCYRADFRGEVRPAAEIEEVAWIGYADRERCSVAMQQILDWLQREGSIV